MKNQIKQWSNMIKAYQVFHSEFVGANDVPIITFLQRITNIIQRRGVIDTIRYVKALRLDYTKYISEDYRYGKDKELKFLKKKLGSLSTYIDHPRGNAIILTVLNCIRVFQGGIPANWNVVTDPFKGEKWSVPYLENYIDDFVKSLRLKPQDTDTTFKQWIYTTKKGPNGPSIHHIYEDIKIINNDILRDIEILSPGIGKRFIKIEDYYRRWFEYFESVLKFFKVVRTRSKILAKITEIPSPEGKTRTIAIVPYFIQAALDPVHKCLFRILKKIPGDLTFDQGRGLKYLKKPDGHSYWSIDLTAATDRFPRDLQVKVLRKIFGERKSIAWENIITLPFTDKKTGKSYKWSVGQPIGTLSSWSAFTLTHHFVIYVAHRRSRVAWDSSSYVILGDDVVVSNDAVAEQYNYLLKILGVETSPNKTHRSPHSFEIGKRWIVNGYEISPFSIVPLSQCKGWSPFVVDIFHTEDKRSWRPIHNWEISIANVSISIRNKKNSYFDQSYKHSVIANTIYIGMQSIVSWKDCIQNISNFLKSPIDTQVLTDYSASSLVKATIWEIFIESGSNFLQSGDTITGEQIYEFFTDDIRRLRIEEQECIRELPQTQIFFRIAKHVKNVFYIDANDDDDLDEKERKGNIRIEKDSKLIRSMMLPSFVTAFNDVKSEEVILRSKVSISLIKEIKRLNKEGAFQHADDTIVLRDINGQLIIMKQMGYCNTSDPSDDELSTDELKYLTSWTPSTISA